MKAEIFNTYATAIAEEFNITEEDLFTKSKRRQIVDARYLLYFACFNRPMRVVYIQEYMKERGYKVAHSNVLHGIGEIEKRLEYDRDYNKLLVKLKKN